MRQATAKQAQRTPITIGSELAAKMFNGRTGHGNSQRICERHLSPVQLAAFAALAVERGMQHQQATIAALVAALRLALPYLEQAARSERIALRLNRQSNVLGQQALESARAALAAVEEQS